MNAKRLYSYCQQNAQTRSSLDSVEQQIRESVNNAISSGTDYDAYQFDIGATVSSLQNKLARYCNISVGEWDVMAMFSDVVFPEISNRLTEYARSRSRLNDPKVVVCSRFTEAVIIYGESNIVRRRVQGYNARGISAFE